jgi:lipid-binding SYLF domain-containing protein
VKVIKNFQKGKLDEQSGKARFGALTPVTTRGSSSIRNGCRAHLTLTIFDVCYWLKADIRYSVNLATTTSSERIQAASFIFSFAGNESRWPVNMEILMKRLFVILSLIAFALSISPPPSEAQTAEEQQIMVDKATIVLKNFRLDPNMEWVREHAQESYGMLILPNLVKGGFIFGGSGGSGVVLARDDGRADWSNPAFYTMASVTFGLQIGGEVSEIILLAVTKRGRDAFLSNEFKLGADVSVAAGPTGAGMKGQTADIFAFSRTKGLFAGLNLEGAVISPRGKWNDAYYGKSVEPSDILIQRSIANEGANELRAEASALRPQ